MNKHKDIVINKYSDYDEDARLDSTRAHNLEYLTTMRYIQKYLKPGAKILEVGAATGRYSITLAKMGYDVTAVDLTPNPNPFGFRTIMHKYAQNTNKKIDCKHA